MLESISVLSTLGLLVLVAGCGAKPDPSPADPLAGIELRSVAPNAVALGWDYFNRGDLDTALRRFEIAVRHDPTYAPAYYGIAYTYGARGQLDDAIKYYRLTLDRDQSNPYTFANLGYALLQKEMFDEALPMLDKALELKPDCGEAHLSYANYFARRREWKKAETSVNLALQFGQSLHPEFRALLTQNGVAISEPMSSTDESNP